MSQAPVRSLILSMGTDPNGEALRYKAAADRHGGARIRAVTRSTHSFKHLPVDVLYANNAGAIKRLWTEADVIHLNNRPQGFDMFSDGQPKPVLLHHHGAMFRTNPTAMLARARAGGWAQAASTLDLVEIAPAEIRWLPTAYDLATLARLRQEHRRPADGTIRIAHAPTFRTLKSTTALIAAIVQLQGEGLKVELDLIERVTWAECLRRKAGADIYFDQVYLGYGCNAIEAWGMGLPVVAGIDGERAAEMNHPIPDSTRDRMLAEWGTMPFFEAREEGIADALRDLVTDPELRHEWAARGLAHAETFHAERPALERLVAAYQDTIGVPAEAAA